MPDVKGHIHRWLVDTVAVDGSYPAVCQGCPARRSFPADVSQPNYTGGARKPRPMTIKEHP